MSDYEYEPYGKTPRLFGGNCVITEKMHGTNGVLIFDEQGNMKVGSRKRELGPWPGEDKVRDNFGFYAWASERQRELFQLLGAGHHHGEWVGPGVEKNMHEFDVRMFLLFDTSKQELYDAYSNVMAELEIWHVPIMYEGKFMPGIVERMMDELEHRGLWAEGVIVRLQSTDWAPMKVTFANDGHTLSQGKWDSPLPGEEENT